MNLGSVRILLISDQLINQQWVESLLTRMGHAFVTADNLDLAGYWLEHKVFDCLLLDSNSHSNLALDVAQVLRSGQFFRQKNTPMILLSSSFDSKAMKEFLSLGIDDFLIKPLKVNSLADKINQVLALKNLKSLSLDEQKHWIQALVVNIREHLQKGEEIWVPTKGASLMQLLDQTAAGQQGLERITEQARDLIQPVSEVSLVHLNKSLGKIEEFILHQWAA